VTTCHRLSRRGSTPVGCLLQHLTPYYDTTTTLPPTVPPTPPAPLPAAPSSAPAARFDKRRSLQSSVSHLALKQNPITNRIVAYVTTLVTCQCQLNCQLPTTDFKTTLLPSPPPLPPPPNFLPLVPPLLSRGRLPPRLLDIIDSSTL
jgi:hypothetical protein